MIAQPILPPGPFINGKRNALTKSNIFFSYSVYMNLWFIILKVQHKILKKSNSRSTNFSCTIICFILIAACAHLKYSLWITFKKFHAVLLLATVPRCAEQLGQTTTILENYSMFCSVTTLLVILSPSGRVL